MKYFGITLGVFIVFFVNVILAQIKEEDVQIQMEIETKKKEFEKLYKRLSKSGADVRWANELQHIGKHAMQSKDLFSILGLYRIAITIVKGEKPGHKDEQKMLNYVDEISKKIENNIRTLNREKIAIGTEVLFLKSLYKLVENDYLKEASSIVYELDKVVEEKLEMMHKCHADFKKFSKVLKKARGKKKRRALELKREMELLEEQGHKNIYELSKMVKKALEVLGKKTKSTDKKPSWASKEQKDNNNTYESPICKFRIKKPPYKSWKFKIKQGNSHLAVKIEHKSELAGVELVVMHNPHYSLKKLAKHYRNETQLGLDDYKKIKIGKYRFKRKAAYRDIFTGKLRGKGDVVFYFDRRMFRHSDFGYSLTKWVLKSQKSRFDSKLDSTVRSFSFR